MHNGISINALAQEFGLDRGTVKSALDAAGLKFKYGPNRSHLCNAKSVRAALSRTHGVMAQTRQQRLQLLTEQRLLAQRKREEFDKEHMPMSEFHFWRRSMHVAMTRFLRGLELPYPQEIAGEHAYVRAQIEAFREMKAIPEDELKRAEKLLHEAEGRLAEAVTAGLSDNWQEVPLELRLSFCVGDPYSETVISR